MNRARFAAIVEEYPRLRIAVLGDFCLDRYLEIDPASRETSLETSLPVHNVTRVRPQPGGAGTIVSNLSALGIGTILPVGFVGEDGEGFELWHALERCPGVRLDYFVRTAQRRTFTYCKPILVETGKAPLELNRLDFKNWTPTPALVQGLLLRHLQGVADPINALMVLDQVDVPETGVVTPKILDGLRDLCRQNPDLLVVADSRRGLRGYPPVVFKMNDAELMALSGATSPLSLVEIQAAARALAHVNRRMVFVTLGGQGVLGADPSGETVHLPALPVRGAIDAVGAGDAVSANLTAALAARATLGEALELANAAASIVVHKLGTTGTATVAEIAGLVATD